MPDIGQADRAGQDIFLSSTVRDSSSSSGFLRMTVFVVAQSPKVPAFIVRVKIYPLGRKTVQ